MKSNIFRIVLFVMALAFVINGFLLQSSLHKSAIESVIQERDEQLFSLAYSIDNNLNLSFEEIKSDLRIVIRDSDASSIERRFLEKHSTNEIEEMLSVSNLQTKENVYGVAVRDLDELILVLGENRNASYHIEFEEENDILWLIQDDQDEYYAALQVKSYYTDLEYFVLLDLNNFYAHIVPEELRIANWIVFYEEDSGLLLQNHDNQSAYMRLTEKEILERHDGYTIIMENQKKKQRGAVTYKYKNYFEKVVDERIITLPSCETVNGTLAIGISRDSEQFYNMMRKHQQMNTFATVCILIFTVIITVLGLNTINHIRNIETEKVYLEKENGLIQELTIAQLKNSTNQMQPHFMYNALSSIRELILEDPEYASDLLYDFTRYLRACIKSMGADTGINTRISFSEEIQNIEAYANIEKMRLGNKLQIVYNLDDTDFSIIPLVIQPLVENAIRHGIAKKRDKSGTVIISSEFMKGNHVITVKDNGTGFDYAHVQWEISEGVRDSSGLNNVIFRLKELMNAEVIIDSCIGEGTEVCVKIPDQGTKDLGDI